MSIYSRGDRYYWRRRARWIVLRINYLLAVLAVAVLLNSDTIETSSFCDDANTIRRLRRLRRFDVCHLRKSAQSADERLALPSAEHRSQNSCFRSSMTLASTGSASGQSWDRCWRIPHGTVCVLRAQRITQIVCDWGWQPRFSQPPRCIPLEVAP